MNDTSRKKSLLLRTITDVLSVLQDLSFFPILQRKLEKWEVKINLFNWILNYSHMIFGRT